jgi:hypothetical protein
MSRITLKDLSALQAELKFQTRELAEITAKYQKAELKGTNKPTQYRSDQEYTDLFALGPIVTDLAEAVKALEGELQHVHQYIGEAIGSDPEDTRLPGGGLKIENPTTGEPEQVIAMDQATGDITVNADEFNFGDGVSINKGEDGSLNFNF